MQRHTEMTIAIAVAMGTTSCADQNDRVDDGAGTDTIGTQTSGDITTIGTTTIGTTTSTDDATATALDTTAATGGADTTTAADTTGATTDREPDTEDPPFGTLPYEQSFEGPDGAAWPEPWAAVGTAVVTAELLGGRGHLVGETGRVARMVLPGFAETDVEATITVRFDDWTRQGFGLYVRQNGGVLQETDPPGQGYATYVEGGYMQTIGIWRETNGVEELLAAAEVPGGVLAAGVPYRLRLQVRAEGPHTRLRTRLWELGQKEPQTWQVDHLDDTPVLQGTAGSFALDLYNYTGIGGVLVDDLHIDSL
jgi:hypothetical protein